MTAIRANDIKTFSMLLASTSNISWPALSGAS